MTAVALWSAFFTVASAALAPVALLFLRIMLSVMFIDSGRRHLMFLKERAKDLDLPQWFTFILGAVEVAGGALVLVGLFAQTAALFLAIVMLGALYFKFFIWKTGIYGEKGEGWYYDAFLLAGVGVVFTIGAGPLSLSAFLL